MLTNYLNDKIMNYYKQGDAANADKIKAAFEKLGYDTGNLAFTSSQLYYTIEGKVELTCTKALQNLVKTHPDYQELELPVEPKFKFKVGDRIVRGRGFVYEPSLITEIRDYYVCELLNGERVTYALNDVHKNFHLWTIADAKDGDVLATDNIICIFKKLDKDGYYIISHCIYTVKDGLEVIDDEDDTIGSCGFKPATKEDRELLFRKMKEAGYQWDADKKELKKIQPHYDIANFRPFDKVLVRDYNDSTWKAGFYSHRDKDGWFICVGSIYKQCIPFNNKTKHLLGITDPCGEEYINW